MLHLIVPLEYKKWCTLLGGLLIHLALGSFYSFGNISPYITSYLRENDQIDIRYSKSVWIATTFNLFLSLGTFLSGFMNSVLKIKVRVTILIGSITMSLGVALTYFTIQHSFILTLISYGAITGFGTGFAYIGPLSLAMKWFPNRRGFVSSVILCGYGASAIIFDQVETFYINPNNYAPDKPYSPKYPNEKYFSRLHMDLMEKIPKIFLLLGSIFACLHLIGNSLLTEPEIELKSSEDSIIINTNENEDNFNSLGVNYKNSNEGMSFSDALKSPIYYILITIICTDGVGASLVVTFYKTFGLTFISNDEFLALVGSIGNIFNATGRLFWGYMADKLPFKICFLIIITTLISLVSTFYLTQFLVYKQMYLVWVCLILFCQCGIPVVMPSATTKCFGQKNFTAIYGSMYIFSIPSSFLVALLASYTEKIGWFWLFESGAFINLLAWSMGFVFYVKKCDGTDI